MFKKSKIMSLVALLQNIPTVHTAIIDLDKVLTILDRHAHLNLLQTLQLLLFSLQTMSDLTNFHSNLVQTLLLTRVIGLVFTLLQ